MNKIIIVLLIITSLIQNISANELKVSTIIDKMISDGYGGEKNILKLNNYQQIWKIKPKMGNKTGTDYRSVILPNFLTTKLVYPHKTEIRKLIDGHGTKQFDEKIIVAKGFMLDAMKLQLMRLYHPLELKKRIKNITITQDEQNYILKLDEKTLNSKYFVSKKNYLIVKVVGELQMGASKMAFVTYYKDYKKVDGVMVVHKEIKYAGGVNTATLELNIINFN